MPRHSSKKLTEEHLKRHVALWFQQRGFRYFFQEFQFMRRPDLVAINFDEDTSAGLSDIFLRIPFDYLCANFTRVRFDPEDIALQFGLSMVSLIRDLKLLVRHGYLAKSKSGYRVVRTESFLTDLVTVECKLRDWKQGLKQAVTYKNLFSRHSYLAIPKSYVPNIDLHAFKKHGIGLLSIDLADGRVDEELSPNDQKIRTYYTHTATASIMKGLRTNSLKQVRPISEMACV